MAKPVYRRVLLKISGEALAGEKHTGLDFQMIGRVCDVIKECLDLGVQVGLVVGGGNFWRGSGNLKRVHTSRCGNGAKCARLTLPALQTGRSKRTIATRF